MSKINVVEPVENSEAVENCLEDISRTLLSSMYVNEKKLYINTIELAWNIGYYDNRKSIYEVLK